MKPKLSIYFILVFTAAFIVSAMPISLTPTRSSLTLNGNDSIQSTISKIRDFQDLGLDWLDTGEQDGANPGGFSGGSFMKSYNMESFNPDLMGNNDAQLSRINAVSDISTRSVYTNIKKGNSVSMWYLYYLLSRTETQVKAVPDGGSAVFILGVAVLGLMGLRRMLT